MITGTHELEEVLADLETLAESSEVLLALVKDIRNTLDSKGQDYSPNTAEWENFKFTARLLDQSPIHGMRYMIAHKIGRALVFAQNVDKNPNHESEYDTWKDLLGYILIMLAYMKYQEEVEE